MFRECEFYVFRPNYNSGSVDGRIFRKHLLHRQCRRSPSFRERTSLTENANTKKLKRWCESVGASPKEMLPSSSTNPAAEVQCQFRSIDCRQRQRHCGSVITRGTIKRMRVRVTMRTMGWGMQSDWWRWWVKLKRQMWSCNTNGRGAATGRTEVRAKQPKTMMTAQQELFAKQKQIIRK